MLLYILHRHAIVEISAESCLFRRGLSIFLLPLDVPLCIWLHMLFNVRGHRLATLQLVHYEVNESHCYLASECEVYCNVKVTCQCLC